MSHKRVVSFFILALLIASGAYAEEKPSEWKNPLVHREYLNSPLCEITPFVFNDRLYVAENYQAFVDSPLKRIGDESEKDVIRIRDVEKNEIVGVALKEHTFGTAIVWKDRVYVFAAKYIKDAPWRTATQLSMTNSADLKTWTEPKIVVTGEKGENLFNTAVCRGPDKFILLYETNDSKYVPFSFKYNESDDLEHWKLIPDALYGTKKYVGGPALYFENGWYYTLYLEALPDGFYDTHITRSRDLKKWQDAPADRPFVSINKKKQQMPLRSPELFEKNASDAELCCFHGKTIVYFTGGDQQFAGDVERAEFPGTPRELFEHFFVGVEEK